MSEPGFGLILLILEEMALVYISLSLFISNDHFLKSKKIDSILTMVIIKVLVGKSKYRY